MGTSTSGPGPTPNHIGPTRTIDHADDGRHRPPATEGPAPHVDDRVDAPSRCQGSCRSVSAVACGCPTRTGLETFGINTRLVAGLATGAFVAAMVAGSAGSALAGERTGKAGDPATPDHAESGCAFSGLEDDDGAFVDPGVVQNWGHAKDTPFVLDAPRGASDVETLFGQLGCNAHLHPLK
jgi:hypothetical protein